MTPIKASAQASKILLALYQAAGEFGIEAAFTTEDISVLSWKKHPEDFGLRGWELQYPSSKKVEVLLYRKRNTTGVIGRGWIEKVQKGVWRLTKSGIEKAREFLGEEAETEDSSKAVLCVQQVDSQDAIESAS